MISNIFGIVVIVLYWTTSYINSSKCGKLKRKNTVTLYSNTNVHIPDNVTKKHENNRINFLKTEFMAELLY